jgi:hypothetical protein
VTTTPGQPSHEGGRTFGTGGSTGRVADRPASPHSVTSTPSQPAHEGVPGGRTFGTGGANGRPSINDRPGPSVTRMPDRPVHTVTTPSGARIERTNSGMVRRVELPNGGHVYHPPAGPRRVEMVRPGGRVVVATAPGHGYVQRPIVVNNVTIVKRTYIYGGRPAAVIYRPRIYNGVNLYVYTPVRYYRPAFYVYAYRPWPRPIPYAWGWSVSPWYGYYGGYFRPYPVYASPSLWLTDYLLAATLENAYQERMAANSMPANNYAPSGGQSVPLSPEVKDQIAEEVRRQIDMEKSEQMAGGGNGQANTVLSDNVPHVFVANASYAYNSNSGECSITEGDVLQMNGAPPLNVGTANLMVLASRGQDCPKGATVQVPLQDIQEWNNAMRATIDRGLGDLQAKQGQEGIPVPPAGSTGTIDTQWASQAHPDADAPGDVTGTLQESDRAEQQAVNQAQPMSAYQPTTPTAPASNTPTLVLGMSLDQVKAIQGEPSKIVDLGNKKIYVYKDLKITFTDGWVTNIE